MSSTEGNTEGNTDGISSMRYQRATSEVESTSNRVAGGAALEGGPQMRVKERQAEYKKRRAMCSPVGISLIYKVSIFVTTLKIKIPIRKM